MTSLMPTPGQWSGGVFQLPIRVYYEDTDMGGMVYHGRYVSFFERVRSESIRGTCLDVDTLMQRDQTAGGSLIYVVRNINVTYHRQAMAGDVLVGHSMAVKVRAAAVEARQWIVRDGDLVADAAVLIAIVDENGMPRRWPPECKAQWQAWADEAVDSPLVPTQIQRG